MNVTPYTWPAVTYDQIRSIIDNATTLPEYTFPVHCTVQKGSYMVTPLQLRARRPLVLVDKKWVAKGTDQHGIRYATYGALHVDIANRVTGKVTSDLYSAIYTRALAAMCSAPLPGDKQPTTEAKLDELRSTPIYKLITGYVPDKMFRFTKMSASDKRTRLGYYLAFAEFLISAAIPGFATLSDDLAVRANEIRSTTRHMPFGADSTFPPSPYQFDTDKTVDIYARLSHSQDVMQRICAIVDFAALFVRSLQEAKQPLATELPTNVVYGIPPANHPGPWLGPTKVHELSPPDYHRWLTLVSTPPAPSLPIRIDPTDSELPRPKRSRSDITHAPIAADELESMYWENKLILTRVMKGLPHQPPSFTRGCSAERERDDPDTKNEIKRLDTRLTETQITGAVTGETVHHLVNQVASLEMAINSMRAAFHAIPTQPLQLMTTAPMHSTVSEPDINALMSQIQQFMQ